MTARNIPGLADVNWSELVVIGGEARADLEMDRDAFVPWPYETIDEVTGPMAPGEVWSVAGRSGNGKTSFIRRAVQKWIERGVSVAVFPLETTARRYLTEMVAVRLGYYPGDIVSGRLPADDSRVRAVDAEIERLTLDSAFAKRLKIAELRVLTVDAFTDTVERSVEEIGARIVVIDHIDHLASDANQYGEWVDSVRVVRACLDVAQDFGVVVVFMTQLNGGIYNPQDRLAKYGPPQDQHIRNGQAKREICAGMLGLFRPLRSLGSTETPDEFLKKLKGARKGSLDPEVVLDPDAVGVIAMKLRNYGDREGRRMYLRFNRGKIEDFALHGDRYARGPVGTTPRVGA